MKNIIRHPEPALPVVRRQRLCRRSAGRLDSGSRYLKIAASSTPRNDRPLFIKFLISFLFFSLFVKNSFAASDLTVDFHAPTNAPIFSTANMKPGQIETRIVTIKNTSSDSKLVATKAKNVTSATTLSSVMNISIKLGSTFLYGPTTLSTFFTQSTSITGIQLLNLTPNQQQDISISVSFPSSASNEFQNKSLSFDIDIGATIELPQQCQGLSLTNEIIGTSKRDLLTGTTGNDLIVGMDGNDYIDGKGGNDCIVAGDGNDIMRGGEGHDVLLGGGSFDILFGDNGNDILIDSKKSDILFGGNGLDLCSSAAFMFQCETSI